MLVGIIQGVVEVKVDGLHIAIVAGVAGIVNLVIPATGIGTGALVGVAVVEVARQQAAPGVGNAQRAMDKHFDFHVRAFLTDFRHFVQTQLA